MTFDEFCRLNRIDPGGDALALWLGGVDAGIARERETCARIAELTGDEMDDALAVNCGYEIARLIRAGGGP